MKAFNKILHKLSEETQVDFFRYKSTTLKRRIHKRIDQFNFNNIDDYVDYLEHHPEELKELFKTVLIGVTEFFRDKDAFKTLRQHITSVVASRSANEPVRLWVVGCATGEEVYTLAIMLADIFKEETTKRVVKIFATDISDEALAYARKGIYPASALEKLSASQIDDYFIARENNYYEVREEIKKMIIFSRHDISHDPPFVKIDLISCRNLLIYQNAGLQSEILMIFHYALNETGILFLGKSEQINDLSNYFETIDGKNKIFQSRKNLKSLWQISGFKNRLNHKIKYETYPPVKEKKETTLLDEAERTIAKTFEHPFVVVNSKGDILESKGELQPFLDFNVSDNNINLLKSAGKSLYYELNKVFSNVRQSGLPSNTDIVHFRFYDTDYHIRLKVKPFLYQVNTTCYLVIFESFDKQDIVSKWTNPEYEEAGHKHISELKQELMSAREQIETLRSELEDSYAESQALNEELQSTNEELKSANEELESSNEELQSLNEELSDSNLQLSNANKALKEKEQKLIESEEKFRLITENSQDLVCLHDVKGNYLYISPSIEKLTGFKQDELTGKNPYDFFHIEDIPEIREAHDQSINGDLAYVQYRFRKKDGSYIWFETTTTPIFDEAGNLHSLQTSSRNINARKNAEEALRQREAMLAESQQVSKTGSWEYNLLTGELYFSKETFRIYGYDSRYGEPGFQEFKNLREPKYADKGMSRIDQVINDKIPHVYEFRLNLKDGYTKWIESNLKVAFNEYGQVEKIFGTDQDITERKLAEESIKSSEERFRQLVELSPYAFLIHQHEKVVYANPEAARLLNAEYPGQLLGMNILSIIAPEYKEMVKERIKKTLQEYKKLAKLEEKFLRLDGTEVDVEVVGIPCMYEGKPAIQVIAQDITDRKLVEKRLLESHKRFNMVIQGANDGIWDLNVQTNEMYFSPRFKELLGYEETDLNHGYNDFVNLIHADDYPAFRRNMRHHFEKDRPFFLEFRLRSKNGDYLWFQAKGMVEKNEKGQPVRMVGSVSDINERKLFEENLIREKNFSQYLLSSLPGTFYMFDENERMVKWNKNLEIVTGYTTEEIAKLPATTFVAPEEREAVKKAIGKVFEQGSFRIESLQYTKDKQRIPFLFTGVYVEQEDKKYLLGMGIDISEKQKTREELEKSEAKLKAAFENLPFEFWTADPDGTINMQNPVSVHKTGKQKGKKYEEAGFNEAYLKQLLQKHREVLEGKIADTEIEVWEDGEEKYINQILAPVFIGDKIKGVLGVNIDITESQKSKKLVEEQKEYLRQVIDTNPSLVVAKDAEGRFKLVNEATAQLFGTTTDKILGKKDEDFSPTQSEAIKFRNDDLKVFKNKQHVVIPLESITDAKGKTHWLQTIKKPVVNHEGEVIQVLIVATDVTDRKITEEKLKESITRYNLAVDGTDNGIWDWDIKNNTIEFSYAWNKILGYDQDVLPNAFESWFNRVHPDDFIRLNQKLMAHINGENEYFESEHRILHKAGHYIWIRNKGKCARDENGKAIRMVGRMIDITDKKEAEEEIKSQNKALEDQESELKKTLKELSDRNFELDQLVYKTSHDLRAPLSSILGLINVIKLENSFGQGFDYIHKIENRVNKLDNFIKTMLDYSRVSRMEARKENINFQEMVDSCISDVEFFSSSKKLQTYLNINADDEVSFFNDMLRLRIIFSNIISNAFKYLDPEKPENYLKIDITIRTSYCNIRFCDNGIGIREEFLNRIFDMFFRATEMSEGSGLGMYIVKQSVDYLGGTVDIESDPGQGTTIQINLPNHYHDHVISK